MKRALLIGAAIAVTGVAAFVFAPRKGGPQAAPATAAAFTGPRPTTTNGNATEVFQRAFWRRPSPTDKILHAERREWTGDGGVKKWQWFIVVEPSPELVKHLREENAFGLTAASSVGKIENPPVWFTPPAGADIFQAPNGNLRLVFSKSQPLLYATDLGEGFASATPEPAR
jgi:hypothetical protein